MSLPHNIERRLIVGTTPWASYRGWGASGALYLIGGTSGAWYARPSQYHPAGPGFQPTIFAPTLDKMGAKLAAIGQERAA